MLAILHSLHALAAVVWVGGMFFAHFILRPSIAQFAPEQRISLMQEVFKRFFLWVWGAIVLLWLSGLGLILLHGGMAHINLYVHIMLTVGLLMTGIFAYIFFALYTRFYIAIINQNQPAAAEALAKIRKFILINLSLGTLTIIIATAGRFTASLI